MGRHAPYVLFQVLIMEGNLPSLLGLKVQLGPCVLVLKFRGFGRLNKAIFSEHWLMEHGFDKNLNGVSQNGGASRDSSDRYIERERERESEK